jgi:DNA-binding transcriptional LysR family regulator
MTFDQLNVFIAVAEREHLTRAAEAIRLTPSAVSASIKSLETFYGVELFHRVGRRIELTQVGRVFLNEAKITLARVRAAELMLSELGGLQRGELNLYASQTIASYWLPPVMMQFHAAYPGIGLNLTIGNTRTVAEAVIEGQADLGLVEGAIDAPALASITVAEDALVVVVAPHHPWADGRPLSPRALTSESGWIMRESGSGTRSAFEAAMRGFGVSPETMQIALVFPSNEAVLSAVRAGACATAISRAAAELHLQQGLLVKAAFDLPARQFRLLRHKERHASKASTVLETMCRNAAAG